MVNKQLKYFTRQRYNDSAYEQFDERGLESMKNMIMYSSSILPRRETGLRKSKSISISIDLRIRRLPIESVF